MLPDSSKKSPCPKCKTKLRRDLFCHTGYDDTNFERNLEETEKKVFKVFDYTRDDFDSVQNYNYFLEYRDNIVFNLLTKTNVHEQKEKMKEHKQLRSNRGGIVKRKKQTLEEEKLTRRRYIIEEFIRIRKRMSRREILTSKRLNGHITVENCQSEGFRIEQEDFLLAQKEKGVYLRATKPTDAVTNISYVPVNPMSQERSSQPVPVDIEKANITIKTLSEGAHAELETWKKLNDDEKRRSKIASGWSDMLFVERTKVEALTGLFM
jgi:hypothetical protein